MKNENEINYEKIEEGFRLRKTNILSNQLKEPKRRTFVTAQNPFGFNDQFLCKTEN